MKISILKKIVNTYKQLSLHLGQKLFLNNDIKMNVL